MLPALKKSIVIPALCCLSSSAFALDEAKTSCTLMTYNIQVGLPLGKKLGVDIAGKKELDNIAGVIEKYHPDIVGLQEIDCEYGVTTNPPKLRSSQLNMPRYLAMKLDMGYAFGGRLNDRKTKGGNPKYIEWGTADHWFNNGEPHAEVGNAMLFKHPFKVLTNIALPILDGQTRRCAIRSEVYIGANKESSGTKVIVYNTHLQFDNPQTRLDQITKILKSAKKDAAEVPVFIMGDLNHSMDDGDKSTTNTIRVVKEAGFHDLYEGYFKANNKPVSPTWPSSTPVHRFDYIFCSRPFKVTNAEAPNTKVSDHRPVVVTIEM